MDLRSVHNSMYLIDAAVRSGSDGRATANLKSKPAVKRKRS